MFTMVTDKSVPVSTPFHGSDAARVSSINLAALGLSVLTYAVGESTEKVRVRRVVAAQAVRTLPALVVTSKVHTIHSDVPAFNYGGLYCADTTEFGRQLGLCMLAPGSEKDDDGGLQLHTWTWSLPAAAVSSETYSTSMKLLRSVRSAVCAQAQLAAPEGEFHGLSVDFDSQLLSTATSPATVPAIVMQVS
jgi:hypothetical protein